MKNGKSHKNISKVILSVTFLFSLIILILIGGSVVKSISSSHQQSQRINQFKEALPNNQWEIHVGHMDMFGEGKVDDNHESHSISNGIIHASDNDNTGDAQYHIDGSHIYLNNFTNVADPNDVATSSDNRGNSPTAKIDIDTTINSAVRSALNDHEKNAVYVFNIKNSDKVIVFTKA